ncbi:MAG: hypothetical protein SV760_05900, partial [Halobacteria archaeon]|nr:hypothetical protein [Halobacteria archaeon]
TPDSSFGDSVQRKPAADVSATFDSNDDEVSVSFFSSSNAEYVEVTFSGDVTAEGRLNEVGDSLTLGPDGLSAGGSADVVSGSDVSLQDGDTVTVKAVAHTSGGTSAVILEQTGEV